MSLVFHNFKKDARHLRILLVVWFLLVVLQAALSGTGLAGSADDMVMQMLFQTLSFLVPLFQYILILVMIPMLVHGEPLVGVTAFWFTRPISRQTLLKSKLVFVGLLILLPPFLAEMLMLASNGATAAQIVLAVPEILLERISGLMIAVVLAVLTPSFARFAVVGVSVFIAFMLISWIAMMARMFIDAASFMTSNTQWSLIASRQIIIHVVSITAGLTIALNQYLTRRTSRSVFVAVLGALALMLVQHAWPWSFMPSGAWKAPVAGTIDEESLRISMDTSDIRVSDHFEFRRSKQRRKTVKGVIKVEGLPPTHVAAVESVSADLKLNDGSPLETAADSARSFVMSQWDHEALQAVLGEMEIVNAERTMIHSRDLFTLKEDDYYKIKGEPVDADMNVEFKVMRYSVVAALPLERKAEYRKGPEQTLITDVLRRSFGCTVMLRERTINLLFDGNPQAMPSNPFRESRVKYVLANKSKGEAFLPENDHAGLPGFNQSRRLNIQSKTLNFQSKGGKYIPRIDEEWLDGAELLRLEEVPVSRLKKSFVVEDLVIDDEGCRGGPRGMPHKEGPDKAALDELELSPDADKQEIVEYVKAIAEISAGQSRRSSNDPQVEMLKAVGPAHLDVLFEYSEEMPFYVSQVARELAEPRHKELVLAHLREHENLSEVVVEYGWQEDAREQLLDGLRHERYLPNAWIKAVAMLEDAETYDDLKNYFVRGPNPDKVYETIKNLPGIELEEAAGRAWRRNKYGGDHDVMSILPIAIKHGIFDALDFAVTRVLGDQEDKSRNLEKLRDVVKKHIECGGETDEEIREWYESNKDRLYYDIESRKFRSKTADDT